MTQTNPKNYDAYTTAKAACDTSLTVHIKALFKKLVNKYYDKIKELTKWWQYLQSHGLHVGFMQQLIATKLCAGENYDRWRIKMVAGMAFAQRARAKDGCS